LIGTFYLLHEGSSASATDRRDIVEGACQRVGVPFVCLDSLEVDYSALPQLLPGDMLFNAGRGSVRLETLLTRPGVATFRTCGASRFTNGSDTTVHCAAMESLGLPQPRTIHRLPANNDALDSYVSSLGGFPIVIKIVGGTLGVGTMLIESMRSLRSVVDYLRTTGDEFILRQFIDPAHVARLCVLGDRVVASLKYAIAPDDFRGLPYRFGGEVRDFGDRVNGLALSAARAAEYEFTGVDIIIDRAGEPYVLEVNPPSNFVAFERELNIPIGDMIVSHLKSKADRLGSAGALARSA
jgi:hypothetical protein